MVSEVNKIIYNMLVSGRGVYLPEVGTLYIERRGARKISGNRLLSPHNVVSFSSQEQAPSLVREIVSIAGCDEAQAQDIYDRWLSKTRSEGKLTIHGVGSLVGKAFTVEEAFGKAINPNGVKTLVIRRKKSGVWIYAICAISIVCALGFFAYIMWGDDLLPAKSEVAPVAQSEVVAPETTETPSTESVDESVSSEGTATTQPEQVATPAEPKQYAYYVVMGIFSTEENANRAVEQVQKKIEDPQCVILPFKNKFMVTIYGSDTMGDCNSFAKSYQDIYPDLWVYTLK